MSSNSSMYYSSSSSSDENDEGSEGRPLHLHSITPGRIMPLEPQKSDPGIDGLNESQPNTSLSIPAPSDHPCVVAESELEDDREIISTLRLEEKIVSLMNRVWILETENDVLRSRYKKQDDDDGDDDGNDGTIESMYRDPYVASSSLGVHSNDSIPKADADASPSTPSDNYDSMGSGDDDAMPQIQPQNQLNGEATKLDDASVLTERNRALRKDLSISEEIQDRMSAAMVTLEKRDKVLSRTIEKLRMEKTEVAKEHEKSIKALRSKLEAEKKIKFHKTKAATEEEAKEKREQRLIQGSETEKSNIDGSTKNSSPNPSSTQKAAKLISDLSNELRITMERESKLKVELEGARSMIESFSKEASASRDKHQKEKEALLKHNDEIESINIELVHKLDDLEGQCNTLFAKIRKQEREKSVSNTHNDDMRKMEEYLYTLAIKYEESQNEIDSLKKRLILRETTIEELEAMPRASSSSKRSPLTAQDKEIIKVSSRLRKQNQRMVRMLNEQEVKQDLLQSASFSFPDEQREEEDFEMNSMFPNRVEI